jgi:MFS family permease
MTTQQPPSTPHSDSLSAPTHGYSSAYSWYVVAVLTLANISSNVDRTILNLLVEPIKRDLHITDTQMSLLMGFSFAMFFATLAIPFGRLADRRSRRAIIGWGIAAWSVMTALAGTAKNYSVMFLTRMGVGIGEATLYPAVYSLLPDYFRKERRGLAFSVYSIGIYLGAGLAVVLGGLIVQLVSVREMWTLPVPILGDLVGPIFPWQSVFFLIGVPGIVVALLMFTVREPARAALAAETSSDDTANSADSDSLFAGIREVWSHVRLHKRTFALMCAGYCTFAIFSYSASSWIPALFMRVYGWQPAKFGAIYGTMIMIFGTLGSVGSGFLADFWARRGVANAKIRVGLLAASCLAPLAVLYPLMPSPELALMVLLPINIFAGMPYGPAGAAFQEVLPSRMRGLGSALYLFLLNLIGLTLGPTSVALLTDYVFADPLAVRYSLSIVNATALTFAGIFLWQASKHFPKTAQMLASEESRSR